ncbi:MAG: hypothetical protein ACJ74Z_22310 [Bryobacteraceae bacterium]|jgi:hypothetical protein
MQTNGAVRRITTQDAKIKTATVEVKALIISGKQVTLSVFRQFQKENLIDLESGLLKGVPWGRVNYDPWGCTASDKHLHVVWQKGGELRRACVSAEPCPPTELCAEEDLARCRYLAQSVLDGRITAISGKEDWLLRDDPKLKWLLSSYLDSRSTLRCELQKKQEGRPHYDLQRIEARVEASCGELKSYVVENPYEEGSIEHAQRLIAEFKNNWSESYTAVASTEQLFIAV